MTDRQEGKMRHTPGPWVAHYSNRFGNYQIHTDTKRGGMNDWIAITKCESVGQTAHEANAHLMAAAPDLLEALKFARAELWDHLHSHMNAEQFGREYGQIDAALSRATGEDGK